MSSSLAEFARKRKAASASMSGLNAANKSLKITDEQDRAQLNADNYWDLHILSGRFIRVALEKYEQNSYAYIKLFKLDANSSSTPQWVRVSQLSMTLDELAGVTALTGACEFDLLDAEDKGQRRSFEAAIFKLMESFGEAVRYIASFI